jgi:flagellar biosynthesis protein FliQ
MKRFDSTKPKYIVLFRVVVILTNFLHRRWMDFTFEIIGEQLPKHVNHGWDGNF